MKIGKKFIFIGYAEILGRVYKNTTKLLPYTITPIAGDSPRAINVVSGSLVKRLKIPSNKLCTFKATYVGEVESSINTDKMISAFTFELLQILNEDELSKSNKEELSNKYSDALPLRYVIEPMLTEEE